MPAKPIGLWRMRSDLSFILALLLAGSFPNWRPEVTLTALPMLSQCLEQRFQHILRHMIVQDFAVDAALELEILRLPGFARILRGGNDGLNGQLRQLHEQPADVDQTSEDPSVTTENFERRGRH